MDFCYRNDFVFNRVWLHLYIVHMLKRLYLNWFLDSRIIILDQSKHYSQNFLLHIKTVLMTINFLASITPVFLLLAGCAILALPAIPYIIHDPNEIILRMHKLKDLVNVGSVFLVFGILHMNMWLNWTAGLFGDSKLSNYISGVAWSISTYWGVTFTLLLAVTYLPASAYLQIKARELISRGISQRS